MADWSSQKTLDSIEKYRKYTVHWRSSGKTIKIRKKKEVLFRREGEILTGFKINPKQNKKFKVVFSLRTHQGAEEEEWITR
jgi:hypothetical protein